MSSPSRTFASAPTHLPGLDHVLSGGLPAGRTTLVCGGPGCGKTVLAMEFVARGALHGEPGVFVSFEQTAQELEADFGSLELDLAALSQEGTFRLHHVGLGEPDIPATGRYTLDGLLVQLDQVIDSIGATRMALDTLETLFARLGNSAELRSEMRRLFRWLQERGVTTVVTGEAGVDTLTRSGLEEYVSDCVIRLDHRVTAEVSTRRARVLKYRGAPHSTNEHPFLIGHRGITLIPIDARPLDHPAPVGRISTGIDGLDRMFGGEGYFRGASVLVSGEAGTGKSSIGAAYVNATCQRGERALYVAFEESQAQIVRNMRSVGLDLEPWLDQGLLRIQARRPSQLGLEEHLREMEDALDEFQPTAVVVDPVTNLINVGTPATTLAMLTRLVDSLKSREVTGLYTSLDPGSEGATAQRVGVSSVMDTWIEVLNLHRGPEESRGIYIIKSRGMGHAHRMHRLELSDAGVRVGKGLQGGPP